MLPGNKKSGLFGGRAHILPRLWKYLAKYKRTLLFCLALAVSGNLLALVGPMLSGFAIDAISPGKGKVDFKTVFFYAGLMIVFYTLSSLLSYVLSVLMIRLSQKVVYRMRQDIVDRLMVLPVEFFDRTQTGDIVSRISYDIDTVNSSLSTDLIQIAASVITVIGSLVMMLLLSPPLVLVFAVTVPLSVLFTKFMSKKVRPLFRRRTAKLGELNGYTEETVSGYRTIKAYHTEDFMTARFDEKNEDAVTAYYNADYYGSMTGPGVNFINNLSLSLTSVFGALLFLFGKITLGNLSSFVLYSRKFSGPINETANIISELQSAVAAAERIFLLIDEKSEAADSPGAVTLRNAEGRVSVRHVDFGYTPDSCVLRDFCMESRPGETVAVVGPTGAGKTTLINLLMRFYDPLSGTISVDGKDIRNITRQSLRLAYTMVLQDTWLFSGTVFENLAYGKKDASKEDVEAAAKAAKIHDTIMKLPNGYDTVIGDDGVNLSKGQKQLLTIARAMLLDANMLILDEATSNVDTRTELEIQRAMRILMKGKTCFVIAHRLSTVQNADQILVIDNGRVVERGRHGELLEKGGFYADLYRSQFS